MTNSRNRALEDHLLRAGLTPGQLGEQLGFSDKTVQRWLGGCRPYLRNQYAVAAALRVDHRELWPDDDTANGSPLRNDLVTLYQSRLHIPHELWKELSDTPGDVEMLTTDLRWFLENHPLLSAELTRHALQGASVRIALLDPDSADSTSSARSLEIAASVRRSLAILDPLLDIDRASKAQIRLHTGSALTIYRFGSDMLVHHALAGLPESLAPAWHLRRTAEDGAFDRYLAHLRHVWRESSPVPKHRRDLPHADDHHQPPDLVTADGARARSFLARPRANPSAVLSSAKDDTWDVLYDRPPDLVQLRRRNLPL